MSFICEILQPKINIILIVALSILCFGIVSLIVVLIVLCKLKGLMCFRKPQEQL